VFLVDFLMSVAHAGVSVIIVNNTRFEFDVGSPIKPYVSNEVTLGSHNFGNILDKNKLRFGIRHQASDYVKLDPHIFLQHQRINDWKLEYGPTLRIDVAF
jgi:hypothetical protein